MPSPYQRSLPLDLEVLYDLALDLRQNERCAADLIWEKLDPETWDRTNNPYMILENISKERLEMVSKDEELKRELSSWVQSKTVAEGQKCWFDQQPYCSLIGKIAYFSMEFGLSEALPIYSGGLGILAGDHLKTASDLGIPMIGIGLLYQEGYFHQVLTNDGSQTETFPYNDPSTLPIVPVRNKDGSRLRIKLPLPGRDLYIRVWAAQVGRVDLYLLDSNDPLNSPWDRATTAKLYDPGKEKRLLQEIVLGVGGWLALEAMGINVDVCHINEGHASFLVLARALSFMVRHKVSFSEALWATRAGNVFTTHTSVAAGFDSFDRSLIEKYARWAAHAVGVSEADLMKLGQMNSENEDSPFVMALLAVCGCAHINGVSRLHKKVSQKILLPLFHRWPQAEVPVDYISNGVHVSSWQSPAAKNMWNKACGYEQRTMADAEMAHEISRISDSDLWRFRIDERKNLIDYVRRRLARQLREHGDNAEIIQTARQPLNPDILTMGFARRFTAYKRPDLLLHDAERLARLLKDSDHPVQLIVAGKAHPNDQEGKNMVREMAQFASRPDLLNRVVFLEDYDIVLAQKLLSGVDLWINIPRRPYEASGTSGMKVLANGGLNLSVLDGWWAEAYSPQVGWSIGNGLDYQGPQQDESDAEQLYRLLEEQIVPEFYSRDKDGIPSAWIDRVRESMSNLTPRFSSDRMMREYVERMYIPAAEAYRRREANSGSLAKELDLWDRKLAENWNGLRFLGTKVNKDGEFWKFEVRIFLGAVDPSMIKLEIYADGENDGQPARIAMDKRESISEMASGYIYEAKVPANRPSEHYTPRIIPHHPDAFVPLEESHILWEH